MSEMSSSRYNSGVLQESEAQRLQREADEITKNASTSLA